ncbi:MAG: glycosyltransferase family 4 protein [Candidatus Dormibacteria bacterium]
MADTPLRLCVEANVICATHQSGVGHAAQGLITALVRDTEAQQHVHVVLIVPLRGAARLQRVGLGSVSRLTIPLPLRGYERWAAVPVLPPLDVLFGRGTYLFTNYGNWPLLRSRSLTIIHDVAFLRHPATVEERTGARLRHNARRWAHRTSMVLVPSEFSRTELSACLDLDPARIAVMPLGVDTTIFFPRRADEVHATLRRLGLSPGYVLYFGNIEPRKNLARLVRAYGAVDRELQQQHPLVLAGSTSWRAEEIEREIANAQSRGYRVERLPGRISDTDLPALLSGAAMLAHPSLYEGFGLVPLQAMACATPVLVSNRAAMPEVAGGAGLYVDPLQEDDITRGIETLLTDAGLRASLSAAGRLRASTFTWQRTATSFLDAVRTLNT